MKSRPGLHWVGHRLLLPYGTLLIPKVIGENMNSGTSELAMYGFVDFYAVRYVLN
jgi:hypothetical protein